jgi:hypothetical protein
MSSIFLSSVRRFRLGGLASDLTQKFEGYLICIPASQEWEAGAVPMPEDWGLQVCLTILDGSALSDFLE